MINPAKILHQYKTGETSLEKFMDIARTLGYPMFEWNGRVYTTPPAPVDVRSMFANNLVGHYFDIFGKTSPTYDYYKTPEG